jgi:hypothetical protein
MLTLSGAPAPWSVVDGKLLCQRCVTRRAGAARDAVLTAEMSAAAAVLAAAGLQAVAHNGPLRLVAVVAADPRPIEVWIYPEGKTKRTWRVVASLPDGRSLNTASPDLARLAARVLKEIEGLRK